MADGSVADLASAAADAKAVVELGQPALRFSPVNATTSVFFDETNKQVCASLPFLLWAPQIPAISGVAPM